MTAKDIYRHFAATEPSLPIFSRDWWLDATAGPDGWNVSLVKQDQRVVGAMPYTWHKRFGMKLIGQPALTQKLGPWIRPAVGKQAKRLNNERAIMQELIDQLPEFDHFNQNWHYGCTNWMPFCWNGFKQSTNYTYVLDKLDNTDALWSGFSNNTRAECNKATGRYKLTIRDDLSLDALLALNRMTFARQGMEVPYSDDFVHRLDEACAKRACRKYFLAVDADGRHHAGNYIVWDENSAYGLINGADPALRGSGAASLCMWEVIKYSAGVTKRFDFTGSMLQPIERFFRGFGATQVPYFHVSKTTSVLLQLRHGMLAVLKTVEH
jgi:hypothetical protein